MPIHTLPSEWLWRRVLLGDFGHIRSQRASCRIEEHTYIHRIDRTSCKMHTLKFYARIAANEAFWRFRGNGNGNRTSNINWNRIRNRNRNRISNRMRSRREIDNDSPSPFSLRSVQGFPLNSWVSLDFPKFIYFTFPQF